MKIATPIFIIALLILIPISFNVGYSKGYSKGVEHLEVTQNQLDRALEQVEESCVLMKNNLQIMEEAYNDQ